MGGLGSGPYGYGGKRAKVATGRCPSLDVRRLKRDELLQPGRSFGWSWKVTQGWNKGEETASIGIKVLSDDEIQLSYSATMNGESRDIKESIFLESSPCNYGGERVWFCCPWCEKRVALLYLKGSLFRCRHCHDLAYYSCQKSGDRIEEAMRRANAVLVKLKHNQQERIDMMHFRPIFKPKGMHWSTFSRLRKEFEHAQMEYLNALTASMSGFLTRLKQRSA